MMKMMKMKNEMIIMKNNDEIIMKNDRQWNNENNNEKWKWK